MTTRRRYPTDLTDKEWELVKDELPRKRTGRPLKHDQRELLNAVLYVARTGCAWRMLPHDLPPFTTVYTYFRRLQRDGTWERLNDTLRAKVRQRDGREIETQLLILDSQAVKTTEKGGRKATTPTSE